MLATVAAYTRAFGARFDDLFTKALGEIKYSAGSGRNGRQYFGTVDGVEVTVEHVAAIEQTEMLRADYGTAQKKFKRACG